MDISSRITLFAGLLMSVAHAGPYAPPNVAHFFSTRIIGGEDAPKGSNPHMMALVFGERVRSFMCGASVVTSGVALTAAHCIDSLLQLTGELPPSTRGVHSSNEWQSTYKEVEFQSYKKHPAYDPWNFKYDAAILILKTAIEFTELVQPIELSFDWVGGGEPTYLTGWGMVGKKEENNVISIMSVPDKLQILHVGTISPRECVDGVKAASVHLGQAPPVVPAIELCTLHSPGHGACMGDSGSALVQSSTGRQVGIVSWGFPCAVGAPDVMVRVSGMADFLRDILDSTHSA